MPSLRRVPSRLMSDQCALPLITVGCCVAALLIVGLCRWLP